ISFFFSSRRRHTRSKRDWSSDVCSSDLSTSSSDPEESIKQGVAYFSKILDASDDDVELSVQAYNFGIGFVSYVDDQEESYDQDRSEERRVGKECRCRGRQDH